MAGTKEILCSSIIEKSPYISSTKLTQKLNNNKRCSVSGKNFRGRRLSVTPVAAISEDYYLIKKSKPSDLGFNNRDDSGDAKIKVRAVITVRNKIKEDLKEALVKHFDNFSDMIGRNVVLQIVSTDIDPRARGPKKSGEAVLKDWSKKSKLKAERVNYLAEFVVDSNFGLPGAILITNNHQQEFFLESITIEGFASGPVHFPCNSWVQSFKDIQTKRIFFHNKPYLPHETPAGLRALREKELKELRGNGKGERKMSDRIYDYDIYNDLGNPDKGGEFARPILGGEKIPYPRRCRTGRPPMETDIKYESRVEKPLPIYVPRDEQFEESKAGTFSFCRLKAVLHNLLPSLTTNISSKHDFTGFKHLDSLFSEGLLLNNLGLHDELVKKLPQVVHKIQATSQGLIKFDTPSIVSKDKLAWMRDDEFARQFLAGVNPASIRRMQSFPPVSNLDPETYGPVESALTEEHIVGYLDGMSVQEALDGNRLFIVDYHDTYLPFLERLNALDGRKAYATRTVFFLTSLGTLKPIAIELSSPPSGPNSKSKRVVSPPEDATSNWIWQLAKAHVCSNDAGVHQLVHHWLRTHASLEPFIISAHRQLSCMHPIYKLLEPHMRYTLHINALARQSLINGDGVIESSFSPGRYSMEMSAAAYQNWRFDLEGLPFELVRRGIAVPDSTQPHGLRLLIKDYPYAADGLLIWDAIENWVRDYVCHYYKDPSLVADDRELQAWYYEAVNVGHADVSDASWWPELNNTDDLVRIITTLVWLGSAQHAALNFGQYPYGGYIPNRPVLMRRLIPDENDPEYASFISDPQRFYLSALPSVLQTSKFIAVIDTLSTHSPDEEYLGERAQPSTWTGDPVIVEKFFEFSSEMRRIEKEIDRRNADPSLRNRCGAGVIPYELMAPSSEPGVTCRGVPNSITI
ncbi:linoleate 13S-lipoxygenase 3-1, chloroplastic-like isoform X1 [Chenopodium quinoa]|uniref:linoleate 13S-lipoxygenase 3-1, chloroplastic-like isoform X1 n=1 Tax=Chenopodium quinoa TaxID=63459 RepID=UPI000B76FA00|nr:linoleate 13S-lipoxygenase 3-1, chloroplastic-like isoform X1 [Chenopodium quinoa]